MRARDRPGGRAQEACTGEEEHRSRHGERGHVGGLRLIGPGQPC